MTDNDNGWRHVSKIKFSEPRTEKIGGSAVVIDDSSIRVVVDDLRSVEVDWTDAVNLWGGAPEVEAGDGADLTFSRGKPA